MKNRTPWSLRLFDALASVQLAVVTMVVLAVVCAVATFYESARGTGMAQRVFYRSPWFTVLLVVLGINVLFSMLKRYPWNRHQVGFVLAHVGILLILEGSLASLHFGTDGSLAVQEGGSSREYRVDGLALAVTLAEHAVQTEVPVDFDAAPPAPGSERPFALGGGVTLVAEDYAPHVHVTSGLEEAADGPPALHFKLAGGGFGEEHGWLVADADGYSFGPLGLSFHRAATAKDAQAIFAASPDDQSRGLFVRLPSGEVRYELTSRKASAVKGVMAMGAPIETPWMGMTLTIERAVEHVASGRRVVPAPAPENENERQPAVKARVDGPWGRGTAEWIPWGDGREMPVPGGKAVVSFRDRQQVLPFRVDLLDFNSDTYPGSSMAATYESRVRIDDPARGPSEHLISMNNPLHYAGYTFFQSSFVEGEPMTSVLSVSRSPGLPVVYLGTALLCLGVGWMFYLKPFLARRQGERALAERRVAQEPLAASAATAARGY